MARFASLMVLFAAAACVPTSIAGPLNHSVAICAARYKGQSDCVEKCQGRRWSFSGGRFGAGAHEAGIKAQSSEDIDALIAAACGMSTATASGVSSPSPSQSETPQVTDASQLPDSGDHKSTTSFAVTPHTTGAPSAAILVAESTIPAALTSTTSSAVASATVSASNGLTADQQSWLTEHNNARAKHGANALTWSSELAAAAQTWANGCQWKHSQGAVGPYGENLYAAYGTGANAPSPAKAVSGWYAEVSYYNPSNPQASHFTQVVWKSSTKLGCASAICTNNLAGLGNRAVTFSVCEYDPPGNYIGRFPANVQV